MTNLNELLTVKDLKEHLENYPDDYKVVFVNPEDDSTFVPFLFSEPIHIKENKEGSFNAVYDAKSEDNAVLLSSEVD